ncbi:MAG: hypothetical protein J6T10_30380 [Methanobrevibacter sp.]|nr:hypothetical protein [Methanobrevibacter sp.]
MRKEKEIKIEEGRDAGKVFKIIEMPAFQMDKWATRALLVLGKSKKGGILAIGSMGMEDLLSSLSDVEYEKAEPLLQELLDCCWFMNSTGTSVQLKKENVDGIVEDWTTLFKLRLEALTLCVGFLGQGDGKDTK